MISLSHIRILSLSVDKRLAFFECERVRALSMYDMCVCERACCQWTKWTGEERHSNQRGFQHMHTSLCVWVCKYLCERMRARVSMCNMYGYIGMCACACACVTVTFGAVCSFSLHHPSLGSTTSPPGQQPPSGHPTHDSARSSNHWPRTHTSRA